MKYKYKIEYDLTDIELNELGQNGWQLVSVINTVGIFSKADTTFYLIKVIKKDEK